MTGITQDEVGESRAPAWRAIARDPRLLDVGVALVPMLLGVYQGFAQPIADLGEHGRAAYIAVGVLSGVPLLLRRVMPLITVVLVTAIIIGGTWLGVRISNSMMIALALACYSQGCYGRRLPALGGWLISLAYPVGWILTIPAEGRREFVVSWGAVILGVSAYLGLASYAGHVQRQRMAAAAELADESLRVRDRTAQLAALDVARERSRIAADLQLIVRKAVDDLRARTAQASIAVRSSGRGAAALLDGVAEAGRQALVEMRRLLGVLRDGTDSNAEDSPHDVQRWQADAAAAGVSLVVHGAEALHQLPLPAVAAARRTVEVVTSIARRGEGYAEVAVGVTDGELRVSAVAPGRDEQLDSSVDLELDALGERLRLTGGRLSVQQRENATYVEVVTPVDRTRIAVPRQFSARPVPTPSATGSSPRPGALPPRRRDLPLRDAVMAVVVATLGIGEIVYRPHYGHIEAPDEVLPGVIVMLAIAALVLVRERWMWFGFAMVVALTAVLGFDVVRMSGATHIVVAMYLFTIAARSTLRTSLLAVGAVVAAHLPVLVRMEWSCLCVVLVVGMAGSATAIGRVAHRRDQLNRQLAQRLRELEDHRERQAELAVTKERRRVAREMHDLVAHRLSVAVLQAGAAAGVVDDDRGQAAELLDHIASAVDALSAEMSAVVADDGGEGDSAGFDVAALVDQERALGRAIDLVVEPGTPPSAGVRLVTYRIVQEALTNARKHAPDAPVTVRLREDEGGVEVVIHSAAATAAERELVATGAGHGLRGMHERAAVVGGRVQAGPADDGGFLVHAWLPESARV